MTDLVERLRAALREAEQKARYSGGTGGWAVGECVDSDDGKTTEWQIVEGNYPVARVRGNMRANHIALHDPKRELRMVAAHRQILDEVLNYEAKIDGEWGCCHDADAIGRGECPDMKPEQIPAITALAEAYGVEA